MSFWHVGWQKKRLLSTMNQIRLKIYKEVLREVCANSDRAAKFISNKIEKICSREKLSFKEVIYFVFLVLCFVVSFLLAF